MNRLILEYAGQTQECEGWPPKYACVLRVANCYFPQVQVEQIQLSNEPTTIIRTTEDLQALYSQSKATGIVHLRLLGTELSCQNLGACLPPPGFGKLTRESTAETLVPSGEDTIALTCYKCEGRKSRFGCKKCGNKGVLEANSIPKYAALLKFIQQEVQHYSLLSFTEKPPDKPAVHYGVVCAICNCCPVIGIRYKCSICRGYNCCAKCESRSTHPHPFIKLKTHQPDDCDKPKCSTKAKNRQCDPESRFCLRFVKDIEGRDGEIRSPSTPLRRTWRLRNIGKTAWSPGCKMIFINGDFEGSAVNLPPINPGEECNVTVTCIAPAEEGEYYSHWRALDSEGMRFGQRLTIKIRVLKEAIGSESQILRYFEQSLSECPAEALAALKNAGGSLAQASALLRPS